MSTADIENESIETLTFGCRLNTYESEVMKREAAKAGLRDVVIVNTCAVTAEAVRQARQTIRKTHRADPDRPIIVTGCAAQVDAASFAEMPEVSAVLGNDEKMREDGYRGLAFGVETPEKIRVTDIMTVTETASHMVSAFAGRSRAFVQVQNGCDHRCTFCIIPFGRGNSRSVAMGAVVDEIRGLVQNGYQEVVLTGVDITSYGSDLPGQPRLGKLVKTILKHVPELKRLRLSSIDSIEADTDLFDVIANDARLMPHLHLSLQAGDDMILKRMKRRHLSADAIAFCDQVRRLRPEIVFGADIIAGFPTETDEMFENSLRMVERCDLAHLHVFPFSPREGTPAARMPQVNGRLIKDRARRLREKGAAVYHQTLQAAVGRTAEVLIERDGFGHTETFLPVETAGTPGRIVSVEIDGVTGDRLTAKLRREAA
ncbi:MAG: tRNA (N(6)-L-threonylcarbamoyladenosine(37)-C(2))-methylthiotransferase MtaB [Pseudomonadota bacterium]